jgi:2'-5' RNA ligase
VIRLFAAVAVPPEIGQGLARRQHGLPGARWRPAESLHITLRFAGDIAEDRADDFDAELSTIAGGPLALALAGVGTFGEGEDMHTLWAGIEADAALARLAARCEAAARRAGLEAERRAWKAHVTLAYLRRARPAQVAAWIQANSLLRSPPFTVSAFGLYSSWRGEEGALYRLERSYPLG